MRRSSGTESTSWAMTLREGTLSIVTCGYRSCPPINPGNIRSIRATTSLGTTRGIGLFLRRYFRSSAGVTHLPGDRSRWPRSLRRLHTAVQCMLPVRLPLLVSQPGQAHGRGHQQPRARFGNGLDFIDAALERPIAEDRYNGIWYERKGGDALAYRVDDNTRTAGERRMYQARVTECHANPNIKRHARGEGRGERGKQDRIAGHAEIPPSARVLDVVRHATIGRRATARLVANHLGMEKCAW